jgi:hypothetical protein
MSLQVWRENNMKLAEVLKAENPLTGKSTSLLDIQGIFSMILGVVLLLFVVATGQNVANAVSGKFSRVDTSVQPLTSSGAIMSNAPRVL